MNEITIISGIIVNPVGKIRADIKIEDGKIVAIGRNLKREGIVIDAKGNYILPGAVDGHVHFQNRFGKILTKDDFKGGTKAAAAGGVTTVIDYYSLPGKRSILKELKERIGQIKKQAIVDYGIHPAISGKYPLTEEELKEVILSGFPSFKIYMTYEKQGLRSSDFRLLELLEYSKKHGGLVNVHAENNDIVESLTESHLQEGKRAVGDYPETRPKVAEIEAIQRAITLTKYTDSRLYVVHVSTGEGANLISKARFEGVTIFGETCPQYLLLTDEYYKKEHGELYICAPPLRNKQEQEMLWDAVASGKIQVVGSDHCGYSVDQKLGWEGFDQVPPGLPGVETLLPLMFSEGVSKGRISIERLVSLVSTNPSILFGLYPRKGLVTVGSDADLVIVNPKQEVILKNENIVSNSGYTPYEGWKLKGKVEMTILRGKIVFDGEQVYEKAGFGEFIPRKITEKIKEVK